MTRKEAINSLLDWAEDPIPDKNTKLALDLAIRDMNAWDKVMEDIQVIKVAAKAIETRLRDLRFPEESEG